MQICRKILFIATVLIGAVSLSNCSLLDKKVNTVDKSYKKPHESHVSQRTKDLHRSLIIADSHCDALMWKRDLSGDSKTIGHVDLRRLQQGNVALQIFTTVSRTSLIGWDPVAHLIDGQMFLAIGQLQPIRSWFSPYHRTLVQRCRLMKLINNQKGRIKLVTTREDLNRIISERASGTVGALLGVEGAFALEGDVDKIKALSCAGFRMLSPTHYADTFAGGASQGYSRHGLTEEGEKLLKAMEEHNILLDLAHASPEMIDDIVELYSDSSKKPTLSTPPIVSHTGVQAISPHERNLSDRHILQIAKIGGVIGVGYFKPALPYLDPEFIGRTIRHIVSVCDAAGLQGIDHVGLGSDFDGFVKTSFDTTGLIRITENLLHSYPPFSEDQVRKIMGLNTIRVLSQSLPSEDRSDCENYNYHCNEDI